MNKIECAICLEGFYNNNFSKDLEPFSVHTDLSSLEVSQLLIGNNKIRGMESHVFHRKCLKILVSTGNIRCPLCRVYMIAFPDKAKMQTLAAVNENGLALEHALCELQNDREVVLTAVSQDGGALAYASSALRNDREVALAAVSQNGLALSYASFGLQNDRGLLLAAAAIR